MKHATLTGKTSMILMILKLLLEHSSLKNGIYSSHIPACVTIGTIPLPPGDDVNCSLLVGLWEDTANGGNVMNS